MKQTIRIAMIGEFESTRPSHVATHDALQHAAGAVDANIDIRWIPTRPLEVTFDDQRLNGFDGIWGAPGDPESSAGVINAIRFARERGVPYVGT